MFNDDIRAKGLPNVTYHDYEQKLRNELLTLWTHAKLPEQKKLYDLSMEFVDSNVLRRSQDMSNKRMLAEDMLRTASIYGRFASHVAKHHALFTEREHKEARANVEVMLAPIDPSTPAYKNKNDVELKAIREYRKRLFEYILTTNPPRLQDFFSIVHHYKLNDALAKQVSSHDVPMKVGMVYRQWLKRNLRDADAIAFKVAAAEGPQSNFHALRRQEAAIALEQRRQESLSLQQKAATPQQKEMHAKLLDIVNFCERALERPYSLKEKDVFITGISAKYSRVYAHASRHYQSLSDDDRGCVNSVLAIMLRVPQLTPAQLAGVSQEIYVSNYMADQKEILDALPRESYADFFRTLYQYGFVADFKDRCEKKYVSIKMKAQFENWERENRLWIENKEWLKAPVVKAGATPVTVKVTPAPAPAVAPVVPVAKVDVVPVPVVEVVSEVIVPQAVSVPEISQPAMPISLMRRALREEKRNKGWDLSTPTPCAPPVQVTIAVPQTVSVVEEEIDWDELERMTAPVIEVPDNAVEEPVVTQAVVNIAEGLADTSLVMPINKVSLKIVSSEEDIRDHDCARSHRSVGKYKEGQGLDLSHDRTGILLPALAMDSCPNKIIYPYIQPVDPNAEKTVRLYNVIDIEFAAQDDGAVERARLFVCNFHGFATFIQRGTTEAFDPDDEVHIGALRDDPKVWMAPFQNDAQWLNDIQTRLYTPVDQMEMQMKRTYFWANRGSALQETFTEHVVRFGRIPCEDDTRVIDFGPLAGQATWLAAKAALRRHTVGGLEDVRSFKGLLKHICDKEPDLATFVADRPVRIDATNIAGWASGALRLAFRYGAVEGHVIESTSVLEGLAKPGNGDFTPRV